MATGKATRKGRAIVPPPGATVLFDQSMDEDNENPALVTIEDGLTVIRFDHTGTAATSTNGKPMPLKLHTTVATGVRLGLNGTRAK